VEIREICNLGVGQMVSGRGGLKGKHVGIREIGNLGEGLTTAAIAILGIHRSMGIHGNLRGVSTMAVIGIPMGIHGIHRNTIVDTPRKLPCIPILLWIPSIAMAAVVNPSPKLPISRIPTCFPFKPPLPDTICPTPKLQISLISTTFPTISLQTAPPR
jgi:hypothetical protein